MEHTVKGGQSLVLCVRKAISKSVTDKRVFFSKCALSENITPTSRKVTGNSKGRGVPKAKIFLKGSVKLKWNFWEGWGGGGLSGMHEAGKWLFSGTKQ